MWDFPGGHIEPNETPAAAVVREVREELGVDVRTPAGDPFVRSETHELEMSIWRFEEWDGEISNAAPDEHDGIGWFTLAETQQLSLASESYPELLRRELGR